MSNLSPSHETAAAPGRLNADQVAKYNREGYLVYDKPVLPQERFDSLKAYFEGMLGELPAGFRPEAMDVPHFLHPKLLDWALDEAILSLVRPILGPDLCLFSTHFICKPRGNGKRVPWHEDSAYWKGMILGPTEVCTVWLAIDPSTRENGCMMVIPRTHVTGQKGFSDYSEVDGTKNVFGTEIVKTQRDDARRAFVELQPNHASLHDARIQHGSEPNVSNIRRCGYTIRFAPTTTKFNYQRFDGAHQVYLACGKDHAGNTYADPKRAYPELMARRESLTAYKHHH